MNPVPPGIDQSRLGVTTQFDYVHDSVYLKRYSAAVTAWRRGARSPGGFAAARSVFTILANANSTNNFALEEMLVDRRLAAQFLPSPLRCQTDMTAPPEVPPAMHEACSEIKFSGAAMTLDAIRFCATRRLIPALEKAINLAHHHFRKVESMRVYCDRDPAGIDEYVVVEVRSKDDPRTAWASEESFSAEWSSTVDWPASGMILLDLVATGDASNR